MVEGSGAQLRARITREWSRPAAEIVTAGGSFAALDIEGAPAIAHTRERAGRVKTAQRRRAVLTRPRDPAELSAGATLGPPRQRVHFAPNNRRVT
jgi:hypothetical protein